jgi:hypothetical protein
MAEVKNSFLKSKMNQDLDDRLIPNGEYRFAENISVGKSQADDIGALQNVLGNELLTLTGNDQDIEGLECIGAFMDNQNNRIFQFLTNYTDPNPSAVTFPPSNAVMKITMYNFDSPTAYTTLVSGTFLNFAKNKEFRITGVNLIEGLLFWTDNRNQPRKININRALNTQDYYTTETQISVAKYAPVDSITLYTKVSAIADGDSGVDTLVVNNSNGITPGMTLITPEISGTSFCTVVDVTGTTITFYQDLPSVILDGTQLTFLKSTMTDKSDDPSWPGDPDFLEDRYVRFSYRFKYDDNEYSLMAPFTQIAYIPKQKGFFIAGNETDAYRSTIINWFENYVNNIELIVPLPDKVSTLANSYKITEIDILYKESDSLAVKVLETVPLASINTGSFGDKNYYIQPYRSQKPYKTLPEDQTIRVYDKVPVRALAQESAGNRIIYGNYYDKYTPVPSINYNISVQPKSPNGTNFIEYPNHTLKKNRNYQVGFILADKFGRQSPVVLSSADLPGLNIGGDEYARGSTVYSSYANSILFEDVRTWFGDALLMYVNSPIVQTRNIANGESGLYAQSTGGFAISSSTIAGNTFTFTVDTLYTSTNVIPEIGDILRGQFSDYVTVTDIDDTGDPTYVITTDGQVSDLYNYIPQQEGLFDVKFSYTYNPIGWYSYKIVVRQQEQEYYNAYLPGILNGYPEGQTYGSQVAYSNTGVASLQNGINTTQFPVSETGSISHIVLINDNINKIPRDLSEVGPDQKQYRSSVRLYGRVENTEATVEIIGETPTYSAKVTTITYSIDPIVEPTQGDWALIKPGDGIQCVEANTPIPNTAPLGGTQPNPYRWLGDTVVVSNEIVGTTGTITISSPNWVLTTDPNGDPYINFIITRAENKQYFPTRKADTVISIAAANEFNFLDSSEDNLSGTAALNLYQLQNSPLIGRVSTVNKIGVVAKDMVPFLSVYETSPTESLLELFWETATTGLISDLNTDILTGFDGPASFGGVNYEQYENQDPGGSGLGTGDADSKYVTDEFFVLNQNGALITDATVTLLSVTDGSAVIGDSRLSDFGLENTADTPTTLYRLYITNNFVFNSTSPTVDVYTFTFNVVDNDNPSNTAVLTITGKLRNDNPIITTDIFSYNITQSTTNFVTLTANNGAFYNIPTIPPSILGLKWSIVGGDTTPPSFIIGQYDGVLELNNPTIPLGLYELEIKVQDAVNTTTGAITLPEGSDYGTKEDTITLLVNVGDEPVPYFLRQNYESSIWLDPGTNCSPIYIPSAALEPNFETKYGIVYIGKKKEVNVSAPTYQNSYLPVIPGSNGYYQFAENVEVVNAAPLDDIIPTGLTTGEYRVSIVLEVPAPDLCNVEFGFATIESFFEIYLYKRVYNVGGTNTWQLTDTENNTLTPYSSPQLLNSITSLTPIKRISTSFTIQAEEGVDYEYAIGIKMVNDLINTANNSPRVYVYGEDANYTYTSPDYDAPIISSYIYYTGVEEIIGYPSGIPRTVQDATAGLIYSSVNNDISTGTLNNGDLTVAVILSVPNNSIAPGLSASLYNPPSTLLATGRVVGINVDENPSKIAIQLNSTWGGGTTNLAGKYLNFSTLGSYLTDGELYANTIEGTEIKAFYTDALMTQKWIPPVADRFYIVQTSKNYDPGTTGFFTAYPWFCVKINADGELIEQIPYTPDSQTAWEKGVPSPLPLANYGYNIFYEEL